MFIFRPFNVPVHIFHWPGLAWKRASESLGSGLGFGKLSFMKCQTRVTSKDGQHVAPQLHNVTHKSVVTVSVQLTEATFCIRPTWSHVITCIRFPTCLSPRPSTLHSALPPEKLSGCRDDLKPTGLMRKSPSLESVIKAPAAFGSRTASFSYSRGSSRLRWGCRSRLDTSITNHL